ncbi:MAG: dihydrodipicolinate synthase family protein [Opitutaceae bacterium]|nr:dihydrodipicolinate synthase family protein [Opitutaceae bacterium]
MNRNWRNLAWSGVYPATLCPFNADESIDEPGLAAYIRDLAAVPGIQGLTCNGHTGEIMSLRPHERDRVTKVVADTVRTLPRKVRVISGVSAEGSLEAIDHALAAKAAGADAVLLMPPHHWLRFGRSHATAVGFVQDVAEGAKIDIVLHQYPAWTKAGYSLPEMLDIIRIPQVACIKMGTRDMARWRYDYEKLKEVEPGKAIITCHDEYLLASLLEAADGALVGFAGFVPDLIVSLVEAALDGDLAKAREAQKLVDPLARIVYSFGEPSSEAHQRMKCARWLMGKLSSPVVRRPLRQLDARKVETIRQQLEKIGFKCRQAA